ncbi:TPA: 50S ribosomal protein L32 [bacterium]|jgi:large subunit ribosomal protein L32|nr:50S ribosomal protein L32 [bacterium]
MAVPARRTSKTRKATRRSHVRLAKPNLIACTNCGEMIKPHRVCSKCGYYDGQKVL